MTAMANAYELAKLQRLAETNEQHGCLPIWRDGKWFVEHREVWQTGEGFYGAEFQTIGEAITFAWDRANLSPFPGPGVYPVASVDDVPDDVRRLVIAARNVAFNDAPSTEALKALDDASEAFAARVPWENEP